MTYLPGTAGRGVPPYEYAQWKRDLSPPPSRPPSGAALNFTGCVGRQGEDGSWTYSVQAEPATLP